MGSIKEFIEYIVNVFKIWVIIQPWQSGLIIRAGKNIREVSAGIYFKIPYLDSVYVKEHKLRVITLPIQTLTTKDLKTITLSSSVGYSITSIRKLYETLYHPETTISNMVMSEISELIFNTDLCDITPSLLEDFILKKINIEEYGLNFSYYKISNFAAVRTYRLIQDSSWMYENLNTGDSSKIF